MLRFSIAAAGMTLLLAGCGGAPPAKVTAPVQTPTPAGAQRTAAPATAVRAAPTTGPGAATPAWVVPLKVDRAVRIALLARTVVNEQAVDSWYLINGDGSGLRAVPGRLISPNGAYSYDVKPGGLYLYDIQADDWRLLATDTNGFREPTRVAWSDEKPKCTDCDVPPVKLVGEIGRGGATTIDVNGRSAVVTMDEACRLLGRPGPKTAVDAGDYTSNDSLCAPRRVFPRLEAMAEPASPSGYALYYLDGHDPRRLADKVSRYAGNRDRSSISPDGEQVLFTDSDNATWFIGADGRGLTSVSLRRIVNPWQPRQPRGFTVRPDDNKLPSYELMDSEPARRLHLFVRRYQNVSEAMIITNWTGEQQAVVIDTPRVLAGMSVSKAFFVR